MVTQLKSPQKTDVIYPDSDGKPMADNTKQFRWILTIQQNLARLFADDPNVFVAGDLLWYPVEGNNKIKVDPDGEPFASYEEVSRRLEQAEHRAEQAEQRAALLAQRLRDMGIDPEQVN